MACWKNRLWIVTSKDGLSVLVYLREKYQFERNCPWTEPARFLTVSAARTHANEHDGLVKSYKGFLKDATQ